MLVVEFLRIACAAVLVVLPGGWIAFGLPLASASAGLRFCSGCALSPFVLFLQYYALRWAGLSFDACLPALVGLNLLALPLLVRGVRPLALPSRGDVFVSSILLAVPVACLVVPALLQPREFPWWLHSWLHASTIYELANGQLIPEEARLAGISQAYPWAVHLFQALEGRVLDRPPVVTYLAFNVVCLLLATFLVGQLARELGGGRRARWLAWIMLWFGINSLGYLLRVGILPRGWELRYLFQGEVFGDVRYTPWLWKFRFLEHVVFGLPLFAALPHYLLRLWRPAGKVAADLCMVACLLLGVIVLYPVLTAAAFGMVAGCAALLLLVRNWEGVTVPRARAWQLAAVLLLCAPVGVAYFRLLVADRQYGTGGIDRPVDLARKALQSVIVAAPLLAGALLNLGANWRRRPRAATILAIGGLSSLLLYVVSELPSPSNEYKFMFTAGVALAPLAGVAFESLLARAGSLWIPALVAICLVLALPFVFKARDAWGHPQGFKPGLDLSGFALRLAPTEGGASVYDAIRERTPASTIVAVDAPLQEVTALTWRGLYGPESHALAPPGVMIPVEHQLIGVRGYGSELVRGRKQVCRELFHGTDAPRAAALVAIRGLGRPVVILIEPQDQDHSELLRWLERTGEGSLLAGEETLAAWLFED